MTYDGGTFLSDRALGPGSETEIGLRERARGGSYIEERIDPRAYLLPAILALIASSLLLPAVWFARVSRRARTLSGIAQAPDATPATGA